MRLELRQIEKREGRQGNVYDAYELVEAKNASGGEVLRVLGTIVHFVEYSFNEVPLRLVHNVSLDVWESNKELFKVKEQE